MKKLLTLTLALAVLATFSGLTTAASYNGSKSNTYREAPGQAAPKQMTGKVTAVNNQANTFTVMAQGQAVVISAEKMTALPQVGDILEIRYTQTPGGPLMAAPDCCVRGSKSNGSD